MVQLKKKVTLRTKQPVKDSPTLAATDINMSGAEGNKTNSNGKKLWILVAIIILAVGGYIYFSNEDHSSKDVIQEQRIVQANDSSSTENSKAADENIALNEASQDSATLQAAAGSIGKDLSKKSKSTEHKNKQTNDAKVANKTATNIAGVLSGSLEEKARQVIRGDYGNGDVRKQNLGSEYVDIQGKVNELYRKGAVR